MIRLFTLLIVLAVIAACSPAEPDTPSWRIAGGDYGRTQFSSQTILTPENVDQLAVEWVYRTGGTHRGSQIQCNPIVVDHVMFATGAALTLFALDAQTGEEVWVFDPASQLNEGDYSPGMNVNRGVTYWSDGTAERIFFVVGPFLFSIDATTGIPDPNFGLDGKVDLHDGLDRDATGLFITATSPGVVFEDLFILGSRVSEGKEAAPGHIRAFNARTGAVEWIFHTIPHPNEKGYETWEDSTAYLTAGGANAWSGFTLDKDRGMVYAGTGSASFDFYGGDRKGANLFANSTLALDAATGEYKWHFQTIHHDVWDRDLPAPPVLSSLKTPTGIKDVVIQATKTGYIFVLDRETGEPVFPIEEVSVPTNSSLVGESLWPTQPRPVFHPPFMRQSMTEADLNNIIPDSSKAVITAAFRSYHSGEIFTPPSEAGTIFFPGLDGGAEWGGSSFDARTGTLYLNSNEIPWVMTNVALTDNVALEGKAIYQTNCMACHGKNLEGAGNYPAINNLALPKGDIQALLKNGRRMMPAFAYLKEEEVEAVIDYVLNHEVAGDLSNGESAAAEITGYTVAGYSKFKTPEGLPANTPPWGRLNALDLANGKIKWQIPLGEYPGLDSLGYITGTENYGGPVATSGGVLFIAATMDGKIRAFNMEDGSLLWEDELPVPGYATPAVYEISGKPFLVIACGGGKLGSPSGDYYVAYSLPEATQ